MVDLNVVDGRPCRRPAVRAVAVGCLAGLVGTTAMTATTWLEGRARPSLDHPVDYDVSAAPVRAASSVLRVHPRTAGQRRLLFALVHWGYGSVVGVGHELTARWASSDARATAAFYGGAQGMAFVLLPALGGTPVPWRWRRDVLASSLLQHAVYAAAVGRARRRLAGTLSPRCA